MNINDFLKVGEKYIVFDFRYEMVIRARIIKIYKTKYNFCIQCLNELDGSIATEYLAFYTFASGENYMCDTTTCFTKDDVHLTKKILKNRFKIRYGSGYYRWFEIYKKMLEELKSL